MSDVDQGKSPGEPERPIAPQRLALPALALVLALAALLTLWRASLEDDANRPPLTATPTPASPDDRSPGAFGNDLDALPEEGEIGEAFSFRIPTPTRPPLLDRTALLPLVVTSDREALARALERVRRGTATTVPGSAWPAPVPTSAAPSPATPTAGVAPEPDPDPAREAALADLPADTPAWQRTLLTERVGYGRRATGGLGGRVVRVTTLDDEGSGSIREAMETPGPRWVLFDVSGVIRLDGMLRVPSDTTIDGRGTYVAFQGSGLDIRGVRNVIVSHVVLEGGEGDAVSVRARARDVWLHHLTLREFSDGLIDVTREATGVTVSWCRFERHEKVMLVGGDEERPQDHVIRLTLHNNLFDRTGQRQPRLRFGRVHAFGNVLDRWQSIGMAANHGGQLLIERNVFLAGEEAEEAVRAGADEDAPGLVREVGNLLLVEDDAGDWHPATPAERAQRFETRRAEEVFAPGADYPYRAAPADLALLELVRAEAGWRPLGPLPVEGGG